MAGQQLNRLTKANISNHQTYLNRMSQSAQYSTKAMIPMYVPTGHVLDIGCSDGSLMERILKEHPNSIVSGLELNSTSALISKRKGFTVYEQDICEFAKTAERKYDCVIFSSVLHEISSYALNETERFTEYPIEKALRAAYKLLNLGGRLIIRDGLAFPSDEVMKLICSTPLAEQAFERFIKETPIQQYHIGSVDNHIIEAPGNCLKEFLFTYTWGKESWHREILEKYGILTCKDWIDIVKQAGFVISKYSINAEQYLDYLSKDFKNTAELQKLMAENTILLCAVK